jgi:hypothetical protein
VIAGTDSGDGNNSALYFYSKIGNGGKFFYAIASSGAQFTGQHIAHYVDIEDVKDKVGLIVVSTGEYKSFEKKWIEHYDINEAVPIVTLSSTSNDKRCFGVITNYDNVQYMKKEDGTPYLDYEDSGFGNQFGTNDPMFVRINSVGEGSIWVCDKNGNLENGDYITTSSLPGYGMRQDDDILRNFTVAKITMDCDFSSLPSWVPVRDITLDDGITYHCAFVGCTYHCG